MENKKEKTLETYSVHIKVIGHWYEEYQVEAKSKEDAEDRWIDGDCMEQYEHCGNEREVVQVDKF